MRIITVVMKPTPNANATRLRRFFSITIVPACPVDDRNSEVIKRIIAMAASQRLMSDSERGDLIF